MSTLMACTQNWGDEVYLSTPPSLTIFSDVLVLPKSQDGSLDNDFGWGVYDANGRLISAAAYRRGPNAQYVGQSLLISFDKICQIHSSDESIIYCGVGYSHYGHFITCTLARLWCALRSDTASKNKFLFHLSISVEEWLSIPFVAEIFDVLGIAHSDILKVDLPTRYRTLTIVEPSFEEQLSYHESYRILGIQIGRRLSRNWRGAEQGIYYLSKELLKSGVKKFSNESALVEELRSEGVKIIYPETLSVCEQIDVFCCARIIMGTLSSAFHTSIFSPGRMSIIGLSHDINISTNFTMMDTLTGNKAQYFYQEGSQINYTHNGFAGEILLADPIAAARDLLGVALM